MKRLKELRKQYNLTQKDLAKILGVYPQSIGYYENNINKPDPDMLIKIADYFHVSVDYLLGRADDLGTIAISPSPALDLTEREKKLLFGFRRLSKATQDMILRFVASEDESEKRA